MKFIPPLEITSKIMSLIEEAKKELIIVSPYVNVQKWGKMKSCIERAIQRGVAITIIARQNADQDLSYFNNSNINLILVLDLHAKVYINDRYAVVSSQNLLHYSDVNSIEIGYITTNALERKELVTYVNQYIFKLEPIVELYNKVTFREVLAIENRDYFKEWQVDKTLDVFRKIFYNTSFTPTASYIFSNNILPFADVMIHYRLVVKYEKSLTNSYLLAKKLTELNYNVKNNFIVELLTTHPSFYYFEFVPQGRFGFYDLVDDYVVIITEILKYKVGIELYHEKNWV